MSQRNRILCAAVALVAALALAAPGAAFAARLPSAGTLPPVGAWERAWSWVSSLVLPRRGDSLGLRALWEKEGGMINPDGLTAPPTPPPPPLTTLVAPIPGGVK